MTQNEIKEYYFYLLKPINEDKSNNTLQEYISSLSEVEMKILHMHFQYMEKLQSKNKILLGGPFQDGQGLMLIIKAHSYEDAEKIISDEPTVREGLFKIAEYHPFQIGVQS